MVGESRRSCAIRLTRVLFYNKGRTTISSHNLPQVAQLDLDAGDGAVPMLLDPGVQALVTRQPPRWQRGRVDHLPTVDRTHALRRGLPPTADLGARRCSQRLAALAAGALLAQAAIPAVGRVPPFEEAKEEDRGWEKEFKRLEGESRDERDDAECDGRVRRVKSRVGVPAEWGKEKGGSRSLCRLLRCGNCRSAGRAGRRFELAHVVLA